MSLCEEDLNPFERIFIVDHSEYSLDAAYFDIKDLALHFDVSQSISAFLYLYEETIKKFLETEVFIPVQHIRIV
jgi:hypothetical protein